MAVKITSATKKEEISNEDKILNFLKRATNTEKESLADYIDFMNNSYVVNFSNFEDDGK